MCDINVCHLAKMQASQESIKDAPKCSICGSPIAFPEFLLPKNGLQTGIIRSYCIYSTLAQMIHSKQKKCFETKNKT